MNATYHKENKLKKIGMFIHSNLMTLVKEAIVASFTDSWKRITTFTPEEQPVLSKDAYLQ